MTTTIQARYLNGASLGKTVSVQTGTQGESPAVLRGIIHTEDRTELIFDDRDVALLSTDNVQITGKESTNDAQG